MKMIFSMFAMALVLAFIGPAFAGDVTTAKTQTDCAKAGGMWDAASGTCTKKSSSDY